MRFRAVKVQYQLDYKAAASGGIKFLTLVDYIIIFLLLWQLHVHIGILRR